VACYREDITRLLKEAVPVSDLVQHRNKYDGEFLDFRSGIGAVLVPFGREAASLNFSIFRFFEKKNFLVPIFQGSPCRTRNCYPFLNTCTISNELH
jgi:hypothetical protein